MLTRSKNMQVKTKITYDAGKLAKDMPYIIEKLFSDMADKAKKFYIKNTEKGKDIFDNDFKPLSPVTLEMRRKGLGTYKKPITHDKPLIASRNMINSIKRKGEHTLSIEGYGTYHTKNMNRVWFGVSDNLINNIIDNKKLKTFRKQVSRAFKK